MLVYHFTSAFAHSLIPKKQTGQEHKFYYIMGWYYAINLVIINLVII